MQGGGWVRIGGRGCALRAGARGGTGREQLAVQLLQVGTDCVNSPSECFPPERLAFHHIARLFAKVLGVVEIAQAAGKAAPLRIDFAQGDS